MVSDTPPNSSDATDVCRWVDTDCMLADALTKLMSPEKLVTAISTNTWSFNKTANRENGEEARQTATKNRKQRSTKGEEGAAGAATIERNTRRGIGK